MLVAEVDSIIDLKSFGSSRDYLDSAAPCEHLKPAEDWRVSKEALQHNGLPGGSHRKQSCRHSDVTTAKNALGNITIGRPEVDHKRQAVLTYIEDWVKTGADLDVDHLCDRFGMSRASLYRLFKNEGGVVNYISFCKMEIIREELSKTRSFWGVVRRIAEKHGFYDMAQFNRTFRRHFSATPGQIVGTAYLS